MHKKNNSDELTQYQIQHMQKLKLKAKVSQLMHDFNSNYCEDFIDKITSFNTRVKDYTSSKSAVNLRIVKSKNFTFEKKSKPWNAYYMNTELLSPDFHKLKKKFIKNLTKNEIKTISKDKGFFIKDKKLEAKLDIFERQSLLETLNKEEKKNRLRGSILADNVYKSNNNFTIEFNERKLKEEEEEIKKTIEENYIKKLIQQSKEKERYERLNAIKRATLISQILKDSRKEIENCNKVITEKNRMIIMEKLKLRNLVNLPQREIIKTKESITPLPSKRIRKIIRENKKKSKFKQDYQIQQNNEREMIDRYSTIIKENLTHGELI